MGRWGCNCGAIRGLLLPLLPPSALQKQWGRMEAPKEAWGSSDNAVPAPLLLLKGQMLQVRPAERWLLGKAAGPTSETF